MDVMKHSAFASVLLVFLLLLGCAAPPATTPSQAQDWLGQQLADGAKSVPTPAGAGSAGGAGAGSAGGAGAGTAASVAVIDYGAPEVPGVTFKEWKAPDNSMTLQLPEGWSAKEAQVDTCTVSWEVLDPAGTSSAYMSNEIAVFKSEDAKKMYAAYGFTGLESAPVSGYLSAEQAVVQIIAPMTGASEVQVTYVDDEVGAEFEQALCIQGMASCDAKVFEAAYKRNGVLMRGKYFVQTSDLGEGLTWWIYMWGYTSPASEWAAKRPVLDAVFMSAKYTDEWVKKCSGSGAAGTSKSSGAGTEQDVIAAVIKERQDAQDRAAEAWDAYIRG
ncbi:MAG: hypothetical protein WC759_01050 [Candidatus Micrarchaeia archaeon]